jgi:hypothetical protein
MTETGPVWRTGPVRTKPSPGKIVRGRISLEIRTVQMMSRINLLAGGLTREANAGESTGFFILELFGNFSF